jgi:hypothetical protein
MVQPFLDAWRGAGPNGLSFSPTGLDPIRPLEQDRVPDHAIIDQRLVAGAWCGVKIILVFKCSRAMAGAGGQLREQGRESAD